MKLRVILFSLSVLASFILWGQNIRFSGSDYANFSVEIRDIESGRSRVAVNAEKMLTPASTMKLVTTAAALSKYGPDYRYSTTAAFCGEVTPEGKAVGDIVITGAGDPTLYSEHFPENQTFLDDIAAALKQLGIREICGDIRFDDRCMPDHGPLPTWLIEDSFYGYGTGVYPLNFSDNTFRLKVDEMRTEPRFSESEITHDFVAGEELQRFHGPFTHKYMLKGDAPERTTLVFPHSNPMSSFAEELEECMMQSGIRFSEECADSVAAPGTYRLAEYKSPELSEIMKSLMWRSDNMMAETTLRLLAPNGTLQDALDQEKLLLKNLGVENRYVRILDGSGLTRKNFVSARFLGDILRAMAKSPYGSDYLALFPKAGEEGTVKRLMAKTPLKGRLALKSGSMNGVRCYAGYFLDTKGKPVSTVVIMVNDFVAPAAEVNKAIEKFLVTELMAK